MTITAKDFAQKMIEWYEDQSGTDSTAQAAELAADLGLTVAPEEPEPGLYVFGGRSPVIIDGDGDWWNLTLGSDPGMAYEDTPGDPRHLTPASVVPAEPPVLSHDEVDAIWEEVDGHAPAPIGVRGTVNAAIRKHCGARALPGRDQVEEAVHNSLGQHGVSDCQLATDAVMDLLGGGDRG